MDNFPKMNFHANIPNICLYFRIALGPKTYGLSYSQIKIHKYTNTQIQNMTKCQYTQHMLYFWKAWVQGNQKLHLLLSNTQMQKYRLQIHKYSLRHKCHKYPTHSIFLNCWWFKDVSIATGKTSQDITSLTIITFINRQLPSLDNFHQLTMFIKR